MRWLAVLLIYAVGSVLSLTGMVWASALFLWNDIFQPLEFARNPGALPVAYIVSFILLFAFLQMWVRGKVRPLGGVFLYAVIGLIVWLLIVTMASPFRHVTVEGFITLLKYLIPLVIIYTSTQNLRELRILSFVLASSVGIWGAQAGLHCLITGPNIFMGIPGGQMTDRNDFACAMVGTVPVLIYFAFSYSWRYRLLVRVIFGLMVFLTICAIVLSLSRGASLGLGASALLYSVYVSKKKIRDTFILALIGAITLVSLPQSWWDRMNTIEVGSDQSEGSARSRMNLIHGAIRCTQDNPIFGVGPGGWLEVAMAYTNDDHNPHSIYLVLSTETGLPGLGIFLLIMLITAWRVNKVIRLAVKRKQVEIARLGTAFLMAIIGLLAGMTFLNRPFNEYLWSWVCLANVLAELYFHRPKELGILPAKPALKPTVNPA